MLTDEEKPLVDEDIEVKRMRRLEQLRAKRPFGAISEDGSGWISVSNDIPDDNNKFENRSPNLSPPRRRRPRNDTPSPDPHQESEFPAGSDLSPPRKRYQSPSETKASSRSSVAHRHDTPSPEKHLKGDTITDLSPPRRHQRNEHASSPEPPRRKSLHSKAMDLDISPPRRASKYQEDLSPPRKSKNDRPSSTAPSVPDLSPPRKKRNSSRPPITGLVSAVSIKEENERKRKEDLLR